MKLLPFCFLFLTSTVYAGQVKLAWTDNTTTTNKATNFAVCRQDAGAGSFNEIARATTVTYIDTVAPVGAVAYKVRAVNAAGEFSDYSNTVSLTVAPPTPPPLAAPSGLTGKDLSALAQGVVPAAQGVLPAAQEAAPEAQEVTAPAQEAAPAVQE
jgi:predicted phage tail protein